MSRASYITSDADNRVIIEALDLVSLLRCLEFAQLDAEKASTLCTGDDYERVQLAAHDARGELFASLRLAGIDPDVIRRAML